MKTAEFDGVSSRKHLFPKGLMVKNDGNCFDFRLETFLLFGIKSVFFMKEERRFQVSHNFREVTRRRVCDDTRGNLAATRSLRGNLMRKRGHAEDIQKENASIETEEVCKTT